MRWLLMALSSALAAPAVAAPAPAPPSLSGAVAYTEVLLFDYDQDGVQSRVQFWLEFKGRPTTAGPGDADLPAGGEIRYYLVDLDKKINIPKWHAGFPMMAEPPPSGPYPMQGLVIEGATARFEAFGMRWTIVDGGTGYQKDWVSVDDGFKPRVMKLYGGDLLVESPAVAQKKESAECAGCHDQVSGDMAREGGAHGAMGCSECHNGHPPDAVQPRRGCLQCHESHAAGMKESACGQCHRAHTAAVVRYAFDVPGESCAVCHRPVADTLGASKSKHTHLGCALCHPDTHTAISDCRRCHGAPHPSHVMNKAGICGNCHDTAHKLNSAGVK